MIYARIGSLFMLLSLGGIASATECGESAYIGFDSRLRAEVVGRLPQGNEPVVGFEIVHGKAVVALPHRLIAFGGKRLSTFVGEQIEGIAIDRAGLLVQLRSGNGNREVARLTASGLRRDARLSAVVTGQLFGSNNAVLVELLSDFQGYYAVARRGDAEYFAIAKISEPVQALSWNQVGMALISGKQLFAWTTGSRDLVLMASDEGFTDARGACLIAPRRAVVSLHNSVVLLSERTITPIVGMAARCRWQGNVLYLLDERSGIVWAVKGLSNLGSRADDLGYAHRLVHTSPDEFSYTNSAILEAVRIAGCSQVAKWSLTQLHEQALTHPAVLVELGNKHLGSGAYDFAIADFEEALRVDPVNVSARSGLQRAKRARDAKRRAPRRK
ncbi:MAG: hypothetical protein JWN45_95 [Acidobacteriaceae bacterium]|nr:hypothetical protein [Acidobacteriaceae bacterium]